MICRRTDRGWDIITQRHHALLAAKLLADWRQERRPEPWSELINACSQHDHGWMESVSDALVDEHGQPLDFLHMPVEAAIAISRRSLHNSELNSRWCALLVGAHVEYLSSFKDDPTTSDFAKEVAATRREVMGQLALDEARLEELYELLRWADVFSLMLCCEPSEFTASLELSAQGQTFSATATGCDRWSLQPWPYRSRRLQLDYEVHELDRHTFANDEALREALREAPLRSRRLELHP